MMGRPKLSVLDWDTSEYKAQKQYEFLHRRRELLWALKDVPCEDCGNKFPYECMDFDHVRGEKKFNIASGLGGSLKTLLDEIDKCDIVCSNCHRIRTQQRINDKDRRKS